MKNFKLLVTAAVLAVSVSDVVNAKNDKHKDLPPGLKKKAERGQALPPGWQKKLEVGQVVDEVVYNQGKVVAREDNGVITISVEGEVFKVIENTREIVEILSS
ncbi:hypothetical protein [Thalassotalea sp. Y01]|uniref:hypothetical protein n=1 Tax=Thalassotalea sp. Y01 TaxID=2729613 RepID=UPI00145EE39E|nr:hypothetical protein [Thalassotalea sp. Y01]NMP16595.1 hypothetical protein [Thalassotalea sp. Y01]